VSTGHASIKGRSTSLSGKKVSKYSPQYKSITGKSAEKRGTTSAEISLADDLTPEQKELAKRFNWSAEQARAYNSETQVVLSSGEIIDKVERVGRAGTGETGVKVYSSKEARQAEKAQQAAEAREAKLAAEAAEAAYRPIIGAQGRVIDAIEAQGAASTGERDVEYVAQTEAGTYRKSAREYEAEAEQRAELAAMTVTRDMSPEMQQAIREAREETLERTEQDEQLAQKVEYRKRDEAANLGAPSFAISRQNGVNMGIDNSKISPFRTKSQLAAEEYLSQHKGTLAKAALGLYQATESTESLRETGEKLNFGVSEGLVKRVVPDIRSAGFAQKRTKVFSELGLEGARKAGSEAIYASPVGKAVMHVTEDTYESVREKPATAAAEAAVLLGTGGLAGAGWKVGGAVTKAGIKGAAKKIGTKKALTAAEKLTSKGTGKAVNLASMSLIPVSYAAEDITAKQAGATQQERIEGAVRTTGKLAITGVGFAAGYKAANKLISKTAGTKLSLSDAVKQKKGKPAELTIEEQQGEFVIKEYQKAVKVAKKSPVKASKKGKSPLEITLEKTPEGEVITKQYASKKDIQSAVRLPKKRVISKGKPELKEITLELREGELITKEYPSKKQLAETIAAGAKKSPVKDAIIIGKPKRKITEITLEEREGELITKAYTPRSKILATKRKTDIGIMKKRISGQVKHVVKREIREFHEHEQAAGSMAKLESLRSQKLVMLEKPKEPVKEELEVIDLEKDIVFDKEIVFEGVPQKMDVMEARELPIVDLAELVAPQRSFAENVVLQRVKMQAPESRIIPRQKTLSKLIAKKPVQEELPVVDLASVIVPQRMIAERAQIAEPVVKLKSRGKQQLKMQTEAVTKTIEIQKLKPKMKIKDIQSAAGEMKPLKRSFAVSIPAKKQEQTPKISFAIPKQTKAVQSIRISPVTAQIQKISPKIKESVKQTTPVPEMTKEALKDIVVQKQEIKVLPKAKMELKNVVNTIPEDIYFDLPKKTGEKSRKKLKRARGDKLISKTKVASFKDMFGSKPKKSPLKSGKTKLPFGRG